MTASAVLNTETASAVLNTETASAVLYAECPHCYAAVMFRSDGHCLACGRNRLDPAGADPSKTMLTIDNIHLVPDFCFVCGEATERRQPLSWRFRPVGMPFLLKLFCLIPGNGHVSTHRMSMPVCPACARQAKRVRPLSARAGLECRLVVHRRFREHFERINGKERLEWDRDVPLAGEGPNGRRNGLPFRLPLGSGS